MIMEQREVKEIYKTEFIDKELPRIYFEKEEHKNSTVKSRTVITVSDKTSEEALKTFDKIRKAIK